MKTFTFTALFFFSFFFSFAQPDQTFFSKQIVSKKTKNHVCIPGTNIFIVPPAGFILDPKSSILRYHDTIFISATTMIGMSYERNSKTFTKQRFRLQGKTPVNFSNIYINHLPAKVAFSADGDNNVYQIITGTANFTTVIMASYPSKNLVIGRAIKSSLETIYCDQTIKIDPFLESYFRIDDSSSPFKLARSDGSDYFYTRGGILKKDQGSDPFVIVGQASPMAITHFKKTADKQLVERAVKVDYIRGDAAYYDSNYVYERTVFGKQNGKNITVFQSVIMFRSCSASFQGFASSDIEKNIAEFKKLRAAIKEK